MVNKKKNWNNWVVGTLFSVLVITNGWWVWKDWDQMRVVRVIDGDTFVLKTGDKVRLLGLDAPELNTCYSTEAKVALESLLLNKIVKIDRDNRDGYGRKLGIVYVGNKNINLEMVKSGWVQAESTEFKEIGAELEKEKVGIFAGVCVRDNMCAILGNIDQNTGKKYYHLPDCYSYSRVKITPERGEKKFCSEMEAKAAGFTLAPDCVR
ncbi:MAG: thermonuclease family protein [Patescibacteria group bacterium]